MPSISREIQKCLDDLATTPQRIASITRKLTEAQLNSRADEASWSSNEILAHLRANAEVWGGSIQRMLDEDHPTIWYVSPRARMKKTGYSSLDFHESLKAFAKQRAELVTRLRALDPADWGRAATFTGTTRGKHATVQSYAERIANHEDEHCEQLKELANVN